MKVISKINTGKLVKGMSYDVIKLMNSVQRKNGYFVRKFVEVKLNDKTSYTFSVKNFTTDTGEELPEIDWNSDIHKDRLSEYEETRITPETLKVGDYVVYLRNSHVGLVPNKKYKVTNIKVNTHTRWSDMEIQIEGSHRFYKTYSFRKCTIEEVRKMSLGLLFDEGIEAKKVDYSKRKIDQFTEEEKNKILLGLIFAASLDRNRNNLSIIEWATQKTGKTYKLTEKDFDPLLSKNFNEIIDILK